MSVVGDIIEDVVRGAVTKAVSGFVAKGDITAAQEPMLVEGIMLEIQVGLSIWEQSQAKPS